MNTFQGQKGVIDYLAKVSAKFSTTFSLNYSSGRNACYRMLINNNSYSSRNLLHLHKISVPLASSYNFTFLSITPYMNPDHSSRRTSTKEQNIFIKLTETHFGLHGPLWRLVVRHCSTKQSLPLTSRTMSMRQENPGD